MEKIYQKDFVDISFDKDRNWLYANWKGYQSDGDVIEGCEAMLDALRRIGVTRVLNDNRLVRGIWTGVAAWVGRDWFPRMRSSGMAKFALLYSPARMSQLSADAAMLLFDPKSEDVAGFHSAEAAMAWLALPASAPLIKHSSESDASIQTAPVDHG